MMPAKQKKARIDGPFYPVEYEFADAASIQALMRGEASAEQQRRALAWIIEKAAGTYEECYYPDRPHDTSFALGSRFVGNSIVKMSKLNLSKLTKQESENV